MPLFGHPVTLEDLNTLCNLSELEATRTMSENFKRHIDALTGQDRIPDSWQTGQLINSDLHSRSPSPGLASTGTSARSTPTCGGRSRWCPLTWRGSRARLRWTHPFIVKPQSDSPPLLLENPKVFQPSKPAQVYEPAQYFNSALIGMTNPRGTSWALTFDQPGVYEYICALHEPMGMKGTITVVPRSVPRRQQRRRHVRTPRPSARTGSSPSTSRSR